MIEGARMIALLLVTLCSWASGAGQDPAAPETVAASEIAKVIVIVGAPGLPEYESRFSEWADRWAAAADLGGADFLRIEGGSGGDGGEDRDRLRVALEEEPKEGTAPLWILFIGHGTFDGELAKLNLTGPDVSGKDLASWLEPFSRPVVFIDCASASGPFINRLSKEGRVVVAATRSGFEYNYARFGEYLSTAITDPEADLDKDEQVSLLEAFLAASAGVADFYESEGRLATEHALVDDNGDALGTPADWFVGIRVAQEARGDAIPDGARAHQLHLIRSDTERSMPPDLSQRRNDLELQIEALRQRKAQMDEDEYYAELEKVLLQLAELYRDL